MTARRESRRLARERRQADMAVIKVLYPHMSWRQIAVMVRSARHVRLLGGETLERALGRR